MVVLNEMFGPVRADAIVALLADEENYWICE